MRCCDSSLPLLQLHLVCQNPAWPSQELPVLVCHHTHTALLFSNAQGLRTTLIARAQHVPPAVTCTSSVTLVLIACLHQLLVITCRAEHKKMNIYAASPDSSSAAAAAAHRVHPADVGADLCEDCGLLQDVAALAWTEAHHAVDVPGAIGILAIQGAARVSLCEVAHANKSCRLACVGIPRIPL